MAAPISETEVPQGLARHRLRHKTMSSPRRRIERTYAYGYLSGAISVCRKVKRHVMHLRSEVRQVVCETPQFAGSGRIADIVPPIAGTPLRTNVGSPSLLGYLFVADAWHS